MNTIPSTFNDALPSYTAVGGNERRASTGLSAVLLNRGSRYPRRTLFQELEKAGFDYVISMEGPQKRYDLEDLSGCFPFVRFILMKETISIGEEINLAAVELSSPLFFVLWNDLRILLGGGAGRMAERLLLTPDEVSRQEDHVSAYRRLCTVPVIQNGHFEALPTLTAPAIIKNSVHTVHFPPDREGLPSLYPFNGIGIYDRERFIRTGGYDGAIKNSYWQLMDFGFRAHLWGEEILSTQSIKLSYDGEIPAEDSTADEGYLRFYLKNIAPIFRGDYTHLPLRRFPVYLRKAGGDLFSAWEGFSRGRRWIKSNRYRFQGDARTLTDRWEIHLPDAGSLDFQADGEDRPSLPEETGTPLRAEIFPAGEAGEPGRL
jgi:hypothetical protein